MIRAVALAALVLAAPLRAEPPPAWVTLGGQDADSFPPSRFLTGYGSCSAPGTPAEQRRQALALAQQAVAETLRVQVTAEFTRKVTQVDQAMSRYVRNLVRTRADLELDGLDTFLTWRDESKAATHVLAVLDRARALQLATAKLAREAGLCARLFDSARKTGKAAGLIQARQLRLGMEEAQLLATVLSDGQLPMPPCPELAEIDGELRKDFAGLKGLDGPVALAALDLGQGLPRGLRLLLDRITYADTPFCGTFSAYLESALAARLTSLGQVRILDQAAGQEALKAGGIEGELADALHAQAVLRGTCCELDGQVKLNLTATSATGEQLAAASLSFPAALLRKANLKLAPDNLREARQALAIADAQVQASTLKVKVALDRGNGGIYRQGEKLHLFLKASMDCQVKVLYQQVDGTRLILFPNPYHPDARILKGQTYQIPPDDNSFEWVVQEPFGVELVKVIASTEPIEVQGAPPDPNGLSEVKEDLAGLLNRTRGIRLRKADAQYAEDTAVVNTLPR